ncbi:putative flotillin domain containing protein [Botrytis fragariae]|uniref:Putative flotillin domain containing protein n=1 Tax=Botrytis fragariae TaxID=1964551 RepID=A0A8H6AM52_9HELO|nr:putative flotillin domain containing protein [Botrytis fragariae]KAF5870293.1 putative flotillin domain containing protein [Botrytis fragariae]
MYQIASPNEYLAITGAKIATVKICKSAFVWPFQKVRRFNIQPRDYELSLQAMTKEKLQLAIPVVFTIGPDVNRRGDNARTSDSNHESAAEDGDDALLKFAMLLAEGESNDGDAGAHLRKIVVGIIEGETRVLVSSMSMEKIFTEREAFKKDIFKNIQSELGQFGLRIYNANVKELKDAPGSNYFASLSKKAHEGAINQARIDVAEAQRLGTVGEAQRRAEQDRELAKVQAETAVQKTERDSEKARAEATLATRKTVYSRDVNVAQIEATRATEVRDEELRKDVEVKRAFTELERLRASDVVKATIAREAKQQAADAKNYEEQARSNAEYYSQQKIAEAKANAEQRAAEAKAYRIKLEAEANFIAESKAAEVALLRKQKEAAGMSAMAAAYADMSKAMGGPQGLMQYLMIERGTYQDLAKANAEAVRGLNPKMTIWNTGAQAGGNGEGSSAEGQGIGVGGMDSIRNMYQMLPPLMSTIHEQTGMTLPEWQYGRLGPVPGETQEVIKVNGKTKSTNGHR